MKIVIIGLGNSVLTDDAVGIWISEAVKRSLQTVRWPDGVEISVVENEAGGWDILDCVVGFDAVILADAVLDKSLRPGELKWFTDKVFSSIRLCGVHSMDIFSAMELGKNLSMKVPDQIFVLGVGVKDTLTFGEECTPEVAPAIEKGAALMLEKIREMADASSGEVPV